MKCVDDFRLKLGDKELVPIITGGMGVDISTAELALEAARLVAARIESGSKRTPPMNADKELDCRGLNCPLPILKAKKALADMLSGQTLRVVATDAGSVRDFQAFAKQTGNLLVLQETVNGEHISVLKRR